MRRIITIAILGFVLSPSSRADIIGQNLDADTPGYVGGSWDGPANSLSEILWNYTDPVSGAPSPVTRPDGSRLVIGDASRGEDPAASDQLLFQRFAVGDQEVQLRLTFLGGRSSYVTHIGIYSYAADQPPESAALASTRLFTQNQDAPGSSILFSVPAGSYFGFYIDANGAHESQGVYYSENSRNPDNRRSRETDHFLMFATNRGLMVAAEDLAYDRETGLLGDQDYNDVLVGLLTYADGSPVASGVPEPASVALLLAGAMLIAAPRRPRPR